MSRDNDDHESFEDTLREIARATGLDPDRARQWVEGAAQWLRAQADSLAGPIEPKAPTPTPREVPAGGEDPLRGAGPHPLDTPTEEQGLALAALDSGRWTVEPGTSALASHGEGPAPRDALGLVRELRVRDWIGGDGQVTRAGRRALDRWLEAATRD